MNFIAMTQPVKIDSKRGERRDYLDQRWTSLLSLADLYPVAVPNNLVAVCALLSQITVSGIILTGGGNLAAYGGNTPERDAVESYLINFAKKKRINLLGVCRGMQAIQHEMGVKLNPVQGHVKSKQEIEISGTRQWVNSYHDFGCRDTVEALAVWGKSDDGTVKAVRHQTEPNQDSNRSESVTKVPARVL